MASILGLDLGIDFAGGVGAFGSIITWLAIIFLLFLASAIVIWYTYNMRIYSKKIILFENIAGQGYQVAFRDRARLIKAGDGGEEILFLKKKKVYRTAYGKKMGKDTYWFAVGQDGYWYNILLGDLDAKMGMLDIEPIDRDMRYMHVAIRKNITERYKKMNFMEKYGAIIFNGVIMIIFLIGAWFLLDKMAEIGGSISGAMSTAVEVLDVNRGILASVENVCSGGTGLTPAA